MIYPQSTINSDIITIERGRAYSETVTIVDDATGEPIPNFINYGVASMLRDLGGNLKATFACEVTGPTTFTRSLTEEETGLLTAALSVQHVWGIRLTTPEGVVLPEAQGGAMVKARVVE